MRVDEDGVRVTVNFIETNFLVIASSESETLLCGMDITIAVNTDGEIDINITIHAPVLLSISQNSYYQIVALISVFCRFRCKHARLEGEGEGVSTRQESLYR